MRAASGGSPNFSQRLAAAATSPESATKPGPARQGRSKPTTEGCRSVPSPCRRRTPAELEQLAEQLEEQVAHVAQAEEGKLRMLSDQVQRLAEGLQAMRVAREIQDERHQKETRMVESNVQLDLNGARQARHEEESRVEEAADTRLTELRDALRRERSAHESAQEDYAKELGEEVQRLSTAVDEHRASRSDYGERIASSLEGEFEKVQNAIVSEQKLRFEAESTMLHMVEDVAARMRAEVQGEREEREAVQGKLLGLLEDTCGRIESTFYPTSGASANASRPPDRGIAAGLADLRARGAA